MTFVPFSFSFPKNKKQGSLCPSEKVLVVKIDLHENEWVYCNKPHIYIYIRLLLSLSYVSRGHALSA